MKGYKYFKKGDKVKVQFGGDFMTEANKGKPKYKRGIFSHYSKTGKYGFFFHSNSGTLLKRKPEEFLSD